MGQSYRQAQWREKAAGASETPCSNLPSLAELTAARCTSLNWTDEELKALCVADTLFTRASADGSRHGISNFLHTAMRTVIDINKSTAKGNGKADGANLEPKGVLHHAAFESQGPMSALHAAAHDIINGQLEAIRLLGEPTMCKGLKRLREQGHKLPSALQRDLRNLDGARSLIEHPGAGRDMVKELCCYLNKKKLEDQFETDGQVKDSIDMISTTVAEVLGKELLPAQGDDSIEFGAPPLLSEPLSRAEEKYVKEMEVEEKVMEELEVEEKLAVAALLSEPVPLPAADGFQPCVATRKKEKAAAKASAGASTADSAVDIDPWVGAASRRTQSAPARRVRFQYEPDPWKEYRDKPIAGQTEEKAAGDVGSRHPGKHGAGEMLPDGRPEGDGLDKIGKAPGDDRLCAACGFGKFKNDRHVIKHEFRKCQHCKRPFCSVCVARACPNHHRGKV